jgi:glutamate synthase (NADPH) small chain
MSENHPDGYLKVDRRPIGKRDPRERVADYAEIWKPVWDEQHLRGQGSRCMDCGVPACMAGCPLGNIIPDWNDLVSRGAWKHALERLHATNNFPEFTGYTCPAPCEPACTLAYNAEPVTIKSIERAIVDRGWAEGWIIPEPPKSRTGKNVAVVGSGPAGLAAAQQLNRAGHTVTVFERDDTIGGLMVYGIPDFKFAKERVARRVEQLRAEGVAFETGVEIGRGISLEKLRADFDAVCLAMGAQKPREVPLPGRDLRGIQLAMDFLTRENRRQAGRFVSEPCEARRKNVVVLGGGDTGADCVATANRQGARQVVQLSINRQPPTERSDDNPWPEQPLIYKKTYAQEEAGTEEFAFNTVAFGDADGDGHVDHLEVERVEWIHDVNGRRQDKIVIETGLRIPAELVLIAIGFAGPQADLFTATGIELTAQGAFKTGDTMMTNLPGVFAAGDARRGQSIVVWAIAEGRDAGRHIDAWLMGSSRLPASFQTANPPLA